MARAPIREVSAIQTFALERSTVYLHTYVCTYVCMYVCMCHGAGGESWVDQRVPQAYIHDVACYSDVAQVKGLVNLLPAKTHSCLIN